MHHSLQVLHLIEFDIVFANFLLLEEPEFTLIPLPLTTPTPVQTRLLLPTDFR